jgi:hypothetical protein
MVGVRGHFHSNGVQLDMLPYLPCKKIPLQISAKVFYIYIYIYITALIKQIVQEIKKG